MSMSQENFEANISDTEYMRLKNEVQLKLMIDAGVNDSNQDAMDWINANSNSLNNLFTKEVASEYEKNPTDVVVMLKSKLYH